MVAFCITWVNLDCSSLKVREQEVKAMTDQARNSKAQMARVHSHLYQAKKQRAKIRYLHTTCMFYYQYAFNTGQHREHD